MAGSLQLAGASVDKPPRFVPLYQSRFFTGLYTQRSPLRSAGSAYEERYLGSRGDSIIDGSNCEITPKLTLARRPGNPVYNSNTFSAVDAFYSFREFGPNTEQIRVMADTTSTLYDATAGGQISVFSKSSGSGQTFMQSVGNTLFFANGVDQKKWIQSLFSRAASGTLPVIGNSTTLTSASTPFISTYLIDSNGNLQELLATKQTTVSNVTYVSSTNTLTLTVGSTAGITQGELLVIWDAVTATWLNGVTLSVLTATGTTVTAKLVGAAHADYGSAAETATLTLASGGTPVTGGSVPTWNTQVPSSSNDFQGGITVDGTAEWINRGTPVRNWGIQAGTTAPTVAVGASGTSWRSNTFFSLAGALIDTQFGGQKNIWRVTVAGKSGNSNPFTSNPTSGSTTVIDGGVTWKCVASTNSSDSAWAASTAFATGHLIVANAGGADSLFQLQSNPFPVYKQVAGVYITANFYPHVHSFSGQCELRNPTDGTNNPGSGSYPLSATANGNSVLFNPPQFNGTTDPLVSPVEWATLDGAGIITGYTVPWSGATFNYNMIVTGTLTFPASGQYSFQINHDDGMFWGIGPSGGNQPTRISGPNTCPAPVATLTALNGYNVMGANNVSGYNTDTFTINVPAAGDYPFEIDYCQWESEQCLNFYCQGQTPIPGTPQTGTVTPTWPVFSTSLHPNYASVSEINNSNPAGSNGSGPLKWNNLGPITDAVWASGVNYTLPNTTIVDPNNNTDGPFRAGVTGTTTPTFATGLNQLTADNPNLIWINQGPAPAPAAGTISAFNGGYQYCVSLMNSASDTVSNASSLSVSTGNFPSASGITITGGIPATASIDPQSDFVGIFRTTDGGAIPFLIPGTTNFLIGTVPLPEYLANGYVDTTNDEGLNNLIEAPIAGENTPPGLGAQNLTFHLSRIWFSIGNVVFWTSGPDTPVGNGVEGVSPINTQTFPSLVKRLVPTTVGIFVFTVSDVYIIVGQGTSTSPLQPAYPYAPGVGILSYNALDIFGSSIGFFATDQTFNILDISSGLSEVGFNIGDKLQASSWNPANAYVTWHSSGEDKAWFLSDGSTGWYRVSVTPSPETGVTISPFATITGGCKAVTSIETSPGKHQLLVGPTSSGPILARNLTNFQDNTSTYSWFAVMGSLVLANPGQFAEIPFITTDSAAVGTPLAMSVILDEALPIYTGAFESLPQFVEDPPTLPTSTSIFAQRFYLDQTQEPAVCRSMQIRYDFPAENAKNEVWAMSVYGAVRSEQ
jgi:hypothetical protein